MHYYVSTFWIFQNFISTEPKKHWPFISVWSRSIPSNDCFRSVIRQKMNKMMSYGPILTRKHLHSAFFMHPKGVFVLFCLLLIFSLFFLPNFHCHHFWHEHIQYTFNCSLTCNAHNSNVWLTHSYVFFADYSKQGLKCQF